jgi:predicted phosphoribosyltransferase
MGTMVGFTAVTGIGNIIFNVATGLGLSLGSLIVRKILVPRWQRKFEEEKAAYRASLGKNKKSYRLAKQAW